MTSRFFEDFLDELRARIEIEDTLKRFMRGIDRQDWDLALSTYHEDAVDAHGFFTGQAKEFLSVVAKAHEHQNHSMHLISNMLIEFTARDKALVETYCLVFQRYDAAGARTPGAVDAPDATGSAGVRKLATARYVDHFEEREGNWRVARRTVVFGDMQESTMDAPFAFPPGFVEQKHGMDDFLYTVR